MNDEQMFQTITTEPALDEKVMYRMEEAASSNGVGINRRIMLASLTRGLEDMVDVRMSNKEVFEEIQTASEDFLSHAKAVCEIAKTAVKRLEFADRCGKEPIEA